MYSSRKDYISKDCVCLADNTSIEDSKKRFPNFQYAVVMRNSWNNGTNGMTRWLYKTLELARGQSLGCSMAENPCYIFDLWNNVEVE